MKRLLILALLACVLTGASASATPSVKAPVFPKTLNGRAWMTPTCNSQHRMDVYVDEFGVLWECQCQWLQTSNICAWVEIGPSDTDSVRIRRKIRLGLLPKHFYYSARYRHFWVIP